MSTKCAECHKPVRLDDVYLTPFNCKHEAALCFDCLPVAEKESNCFKCRSVVCVKCQNGVDKNKLSDYKSISFANCATKNHSVYVCKPCFQGSYARLVPSDAHHFCYLCTSSIERSNLIYYSKELDCPKKHKVSLCGKCDVLFPKTEKRCPVCQPFELTGELCVACYKPTKDKINILPIACYSSSHKFTICLDCAQNLNKPHLVCRFCNAKDTANHVFLQTVENEQDEQCLPCLRFTDNKLDLNAIEIDSFICPTCEPYSACLTLVAQRGSEDEEQWFRPFSGVTRFGSNVMITGGVDIDQKQSVNECSVAKFLQDGRHYSYKRNVYTNVMNKGRHAHGMFYFEKEKTIFAIGGAQKIKETEIEYLDSIENFAVLDESLNFNGNGEWQTSTFKLKRARCSFGQVRAGNKLVIFGGFSGIDKVENSLEVIDFDEKKVTLVELEGEFKAPIYPVLLHTGQSEVTVIGGFSDHEARNTNCFVVDFETGRTRKSSPAGLPVSDRLHSIQAFGETFVFGGNCFDKLNTKSSGKFRSIAGGFQGVIAGGYKDLKHHSVESIKSLLDCFCSESIQFNLLV